MISNKYAVKMSTLKDAFMIFGLAYSTTLISFFLRLGKDSSERGVEADMDGNIMNQVFGLLMLAIPLYYFITQKVLLRKSFYKENLMLLIFLGSLWVSVGWSDDPMLSIKRLIALTSIVFFGGFLIYNYSLEKIFYTFGIIVGIAAFVGLIFAVLMPSMTWVQEGIRAGAFKGIYVEKNAGARINALGILLLLPAILKKDRYAIAAAFCSFIAVALARSATGVVLIIAGLGTYWYYVSLIKFRINKSRLAFFIATIIFLLVLLFMYGNYALLLSLMDRDPSLTNRTIIWDILQPSIDAALFKGYGFGAFWSSPEAAYFLKRWGYIGNAHSGYRETLLNGGLIQLTTLILLLIAATVKQYRAIVASEAAEYRVVGLIVIGLFAITNYIGYVIPNYRSTEFVVFCFLVVSFKHRQRLVTAPAPSRSHQGAMPSLS